MNRNRSAVIGLLVAVVSFSMMSIVQAQWGAYGNHLYNSNSGNVGIGTMNPEAKLDVRGGGILTYSSVGPSYLDITSDYSDAFLLLRKGQVPRLSFDISPVPP